MTYARIQDVPANAEIYEQIRAKLGDAPPEGLVVHLAIEREGGLRYVDVWDSREQCEAFMEGVVEPAVGEVLAGYGIPHDHSMVSTVDIDLVDVWLGATA